MAINVEAIPAFDDNYIWCLNQVGNSQAWIVDPGQAEPVIAHLEKHQLHLEGILITHHHGDHVGGIAKLNEKYDDLIVIGPANPDIDGITQVVNNNDVIRVAGVDTNLTVMAVPGHTLDHIAYLCDDNLFCGDTLFSAGCGRMFEGKPAQFHHSLQRLAALPDNTKVFCAHEYTLNNLKFAVMTDPNNTELIKYQANCQARRENSQSTVPTTIATEKSINPFLRVNHPDVLQQISQFWQQKPKNDVEAFALLRQWKDRA